MSQQINPMTRDRSASSFSQDNTLNDLDSLLDLDGLDQSFLSPRAFTRSSSSASAASSAQNTPHMSQAHLVASEFSAPSHQYDLHPQQTDLPFNVDNMFSGTDFLMNMDTDSSNSMNTQPPFFFDNVSTPRVSSDPILQSISPMQTVGPVKTEPIAPMPQPQRPRQYYSGIHKEMAAYNANLQQLSAQKAAVQQPLSKDERIAHVLNSMKPNGPSAACNNKTANVLPHIAKLKKEEEEMDDDERLLASEEGKKLSSKERRQLRNKVSARAFRSRRKEYITQLEAEVNSKTRENVELMQANDMLRQENDKLQDLTRLLLGSPQFSAFLDAMHPTEAAQAPVSQAPVQNVSQPAMPAPVENMPRFNTERDRNPNMAQNDEWPLAYANNWTNGTQVYNVEIPEPPSIQDLTGKVSYDDEILPVSDGFFPRRTEKGDIMNFEPLPLDDEYEAPENIMDLYEEDEVAPQAPEEEGPQEKKSLDELFPGVGVNALLTRLELIAGGEAKPEDFFDVEPSEEAKEEVAETSRQTESVIRPSACQTNRILQEAESVYQRIGMTVGGRN